MQVIITRPADDASSWLRQLLVEPAWQAAQWQPRLWPLIDIQPLPVASAAPQAERVEAAWDAVMFVSPNAVRCSPHHPGRWPAIAGHSQAWAVGPSTVQALRQAGWPAERIIAPDGLDGESYDSEALWARLAQPLAQGRWRRVLLVRGSEAQQPGQPSGRDWLAERLQGAGLEVAQVAVYQRGLPDWSPAQQAAARAALGDGSVWLISSSQAARHLQQLLHAPVPNWRGARAVATHPRIAQALQAQGWGRVMVSAAQASALATSIKSLAYAR
jgi:uroporphyrinogen-III synthase